MMSNNIGIRLEDKNKWERRVVLSPNDVAELCADGIEILVERSEQRAFSDASFKDANATLTDDVRPADLVLGVKEMPNAFFRENGAYVFFSHTFKGQPHNMKMLASLVEKKCTVIDYELITDDKGRRLIFFGHFAGLAGMIDTLWTLGRRLTALGRSNPFESLKQTYEYDSLDQAKDAVAKVGKKIEANGLPQSLAPLVVGITGYGNVSKGAQEILDLIPNVDVKPEDLSAFVAQNKQLTNKIAKVEYHEEHLVGPKDPSQPFTLQEYYDHPEHYVSIFEPNLPLLSVLVNGIYWDDKFPKLADGEQLKRLFSGQTKPRLLAVGDVTCDVDGSLGCTVRDTDIGDPSYVYNPLTREAPSGFDGPGVAVMAVGNLPAELPREASQAFSNGLKPFIKKLVSTDFSSSFADAELPDPIRRAVILWRGEFAPEYKYMQDFLR